MAERVKILTLAELIDLSLPISGAASLHSVSSPPHKRARFDQTLVTNGSSKPDSFTPISLRVLLIGTVNLYSEASNQLNKGCCNHCFCFSDGNCTVCCYILDFNVGIFGREICVTAWNFLPLKHGNNKGVLEIIQWRFSDSDAALNPSFSLSVENFQKTDLKARIFAIGVVKSVSLIFSVPQNNQVQNGENQNSVGFLAEILTCACEICNKNPNFDQNRGSHSFTESKVVYFIKPTHVWRNIIAKLIGRLINISGLLKKMIYVGKKETYTMFVSTVKTKVCLYEESIVRNIRINFCEMKEGIFNSIYKGVISGIYLNGMIIELDEKVWFLIHDLHILPQNSIRIGAIVSVRDFHLVCANFAWLKVLIIGTCVKTSISINSFAISDIKMRVKIQDKSLLGKFVESLKLSARFWVLIMITCLRRKFAGILSDKDILGSKNKKGLVQTYSTVYLPSNSFQSVHGIFMRFCKHDDCLYSSELNLPQLKLVVPLSNFISKCEEIWISILQKINEGFEENYLYNNFFCEGISYPGFIRKIVPSEDIGCVLIGNIKTCSSGLKLVDAAGSINIVIPDLISNLNNNTIYEIREYKLVIEGCATQTEISKYDFGEPLSLRAIFNHLPNEKRKNINNNLTFYVQFNIKDSISLSQIPSNISDNINHGEFHLLFISHKFPPINHIQSEPSLFAEALISPYNFNQQEINRNNDNDNKGTIISEFLSQFNDNNNNGIKSATRILLEFKPDNFSKYQLLRIGGYYLINCSKNCTIKLCQCIKKGKIFINSQNTLYTLSLSSNENFQTDPSKSPINSLAILKPLKDLHENMYFHFHLKSEIITNFFPPFNQVINVSSCIQLMRGQNGNLHNLPNFQFGPRLDKGDLISVNGMIDKFHENTDGGFCVHLSDNNNVVKICGKLNNWTCPVGFGPGAIVTFHRVLLTRMLNQRPRLILTPTTYVEIFSIEEFSENNEEQNSQKFLQNSFDDFPFENLKLSLFSELKSCFNGTKLAKFNCRVLAVKMLVLEKCDTVQKFKIPLAGFILDDGSSTCCCWADESQANTLLRLLEISSSFLSIYSSSSKNNNKNNNHKKIGYCIERMLDRHKKVTAKNEGNSLEISSRNVSFHSDASFSILEEKVLNFIMLKASQGPVFSVVGSSMDANALRQFDKNIISEPYYLRRCMKKIWVREVLHIDPLKEASNMLRNLTTRVERDKMTVLKICTIIPTL